MYAFQLHNQSDEEAYDVASNKNICTLRCGEVVWDGFHFLIYRDPHKKKIRSGLRFTRNQ
jgi:hypothetical protein